MESVTNTLEEKGLKFDNDFTKIDATNYISYNTSWNMLKKSQNLLVKSATSLPYANIRFMDFLNAGQTNYYYNNMLKPVIDNFEHNLKVYMSTQYMKLSEIQKETYKHKLFKYVDNHHIEKIREVEKNNKTLFKLHDSLMLYNLIEISNILCTVEESIISFDSNISKLRNKLSHHENVLKEHRNWHDVNKYNIEIGPIMEYFGIVVTKQEEKVMCKEHNYNELLWTIKLFYYVDVLLSQNNSTIKRKEYMYNHTIDYLLKSKQKYEKIEPKLRQKWVNTHFSIIEKILLSRI